MTAITEAPHTAGFLLSEASGHRSRDNGILVSGQNLKAGAVVGKVSRGAPTTAATGNTGNGTITMDATNPVRQGAKVGAYVANCIAAATNGGTFRVEDPDGFVLGDVAVGATFDDDIKFVIADGATDFIVGDKFTITIAAGSGKFTELAPAAQNGSEIAAGVLLAAVDASGGDKACVVVARDAEVISDEVVWPFGATTDQKTLATTQLSAAGVIVR